MDLYLEIQNLRNDLNKSIKSLRQTGNEYAQAYRDYRVLLRQELLKLKDEGMAVTMAYDVARGEEKVANAKFKEISTEAIYRANLESINAIKLQIKILENQYEKELGINE